MSPRRQRGCGIGHRPGLRRRLACTARRGGDTHSGRRSPTRKEAEMASDQGKSKLFGEGLPGTGGDFVDPKDVEGHVRLTESEPLGAPKPESLGAPNAPGPTDGRSDDDDVVGHTSGGPDQGHGWARTRRAARASGSSTRTMSKATTIATARPPRAVSLPSASRATTRAESADHHTIVAGHPAITTLLQRPAFGPAVLLSGSGSAASLRCRQWRRAAPSSRTV